MKLLWTESANVIDKLIHALTGEDCGHFAILFESRGGGGVVFEVNLLGAHPAFYKTWVKGRTIVHSLDVTSIDLNEDLLWDRWVSTFDGKGYDFFGALYVGLTKFSNRVFGSKMPLTNKWAKSGTYYCDEAYQLVSGIPGCPIISPDSNGMATPHDIWVDIQSGAKQLKKMGIRTHVTDQIK